MKYSFLIIFVGMTIFSHAQKNEIYIGYNAVSFFDSTGIVKNSEPTSNNEKFYNNIPLIGLRHHIRQSWIIGMEYSRYSASFLPKNIIILKDTSLIRRNFSLFSLTLSKSFSYKKIDLLTQVSFRHRYDGNRLDYLYSRIASGGWKEPQFSGYIYKQGGFSIGVELKHPIFKNLHGQFNTSYTRFFGSEDKDMLLISYALGYSFGLKKKKSKSE
jgi:hypothetical protein